jgi:tRNA-binding protein
MNERVITTEDFNRVEMRVGTVLFASLNERARKPAYVLKVDFGPFGIRTTSAQITELYKADDLIGQQVVAIINFPPKNIAGVKSEVLVLGAVEEGGTVVLLRPTRHTQNGARIA